MLVLAFDPVPVTCQATPARPAGLRTGASSQRVRLFQWRFAGELALGTASSLALVPFDGRVRSWVRDPARQRSAVLDDGVSAVMPFGSAAPLVAAAAVYGLGRIAHRPVVADVGLHVGEAMAVAGVTTILLKVVVGRARPYVEPHDAHAFGKGRPFAFASRYESFPSGHTTVAFALAGALSEETARHWPVHRWVVAPAVYALATGVAFARVYRDRHWTSDVVGGAVVGTLVGRRVVQAVHSGGAGPVSRIEPILLPHGGGITVGLSLAMP